MGSKAFYRERLVDDDPLQRACYVATIVRYPGGSDPATIRNGVLSVPRSGALGRLLHLERLNTEDAMTFILDGVALTPDYDEDADILYLWVDAARPAVTYETKHGHLVQLDPGTREFVGVAIVDYRGRWEGKEIPLEIPVVEERVLQLA